VANRGEGENIRNFTAPFVSTGMYVNYIYTCTGRADWNNFQAANFGGASVITSGPDNATICSGLTSILPDANDDNIVYFSNIWGIFKSVDGGKTFYQTLTSWCAPLDPIISISNRPADKILGTTARLNAWLAAATALQETTTGDLYAFWGELDGGTSPTV